MTTDPVPPARRDEGEPPTLDAALETFRLAAALEYAEAVAFDREPTVGAHGLHAEAAAALGEATRQVHRVYRAAESAAFARGRAELLTGEPTGPWKPNWQYGNEPSDRELHWWAQNGLEQVGPLDSEEDARAVANALNARALLGGADKGRA